MTENADQIEYWNGQAGQTWVRAQERLDAMLEDFSAIALTKAAPAQGERVLDVGCGCGATSIALAQQGAEVRGVDISEPMLARAQQRAEGLGGVSFTRADAANYSFAQEYDLIFSRFGVMFFQEPFAAFQNLRQALGQQGRLVFMCWQPPANNPWISEAGRVIAPFLADTSPPDPKAPGPFAFADQQYVQDILEQANFGNVDIESVTLDLHIGDDLESVMQSQGEVGPIARALTELEGEQKEQALLAVRNLFSEKMTDTGLDLGAATWLVSATPN